jgi:hypothetical protein
VHGICKGTKLENRSVQLACLTGTVTADVWYVCERVSGIVLPEK